jgi:hypothetical protein
MYIVLTRLQVEAAKHCMNDSTVRRAMNERGDKGVHNTSQFTGTKSIESHWHDTQ